MFFKIRSIPQQILKLFLPVLVCFYMIDANGQFIDNFDGTSPENRMKTPEDWGYATGDGKATMEFIQSNGYASITSKSEWAYQNITFYTV